MSTESKTISLIRKTPIPVPGQYLEILRGSIRPPNPYEIPLCVNKHTDEPLVSLVGLGIATDCYEWVHYNHHPDTHGYVGEDIYVRQSVAERLLTASRFLGVRGFSLVVRSGYRHPNVQERAYNLALEKKGREFANSRYTTVDDLVSKDSVYPHSTGGAVDVEICERGTGNRLLMGCEGLPIGTYDLEILEGFRGLSDYHTLKQKILERNPLSSKFPFDNIPNDTVSQSLSNRRLLYVTMRSAGFFPILSEFWHWGIGDHISGVTARMLTGEYKPYYREAVNPYDR